MSFPTVTIIFNRLGYKSKSGAYPVHLRLYHKGKADYIKIKDIPKIAKSDWVGNERLGNWVRNNARVNDKINNALQEARQYVNRMVMDGKPVGIADIKLHLDDPDKRVTFNTFAHDFVKNINKNKSDDEKRALGTINAYRSFLIKLDAFNPSIEFDHIDRELISDFNDYLAGTCNLKKVTRSKYFDKFKVIYDEACLKKYIIYVPSLFKGKIAKGKSQPVRLTTEEIKLFKNTTLEDPTDERYKSIFLFSLLTGLYYSDLQLLKRGNYGTVQINDDQKRSYLSGTRSKNDEPYITPLFRDAIDILRRYSPAANANPDKDLFDKESDPEEMLFPDLVSVQKYNRRIKKIAKLLGISKNISNKTARHSYGLMMVAIGNERAKIAKSLGHVDESMTITYSRLDPGTSMIGWIEPEL